MPNAFEEWLSNQKQSCTEFNSFRKEIVCKFIDSVWDILFPSIPQTQTVDSYFKERMEELQKNFKIVLTSIYPKEQNAVFDDIMEEFLLQIPTIDATLKMDLEAIYDGDPAAQSKSEIILCYPGFYAIVIYRIAHTLALLGIPLLPRYLSEIAHSKTGIDIHPGATIGHHFCIDHGTGIVIGETTVIGNYVKIYQGVTLGALSLRDGHKLQGVKRHPTILDHVTIYSEASIFGGDTTIGPNVTIGSNSFITSSVTRDNQRIPKKKRI